jgi:hypothetical protein
VRATAAGEPRRLGGFVDLAVAGQREGVPQASNRGLIATGRATGAWSTPSRGDLIPLVVETQPDSIAFVDVYLERLIGGDWVAVAHVFKAGVGNILQGTGDSPYCSDTTTNTYHIEAFGTANGIHATPWPYVGPNVNLACRINAF